MMQIVMSHGPHVCMIVPPLIDPLSDCCRQ